MSDITSRLQEIEKRLNDLPQGTLTYKRINGKEQPYLQRTIEGKSVSYYIKLADRDLIMNQLKERKALQEERLRLMTYAGNLQKILLKNPFLDRKVSTGYDRFSEFIENDFFYVDKSGFITEWWNGGDAVTLITRPRRFGKTLMLSLIRHFFSPGHPDQSAYFRRLAVWQDEGIRILYGQIPVVFLSFSSVKANDLVSAQLAIFQELYRIYFEYSNLLDGDRLSEELRQLYLNNRRRLEGILYQNQEPHNTQAFITDLCQIIYGYYGVKPILLLDEYDTPLTESYAAGFFEDMITFYRSFFNETFKKNPWFCKALITGVTKVSKNSLFSDMNQIQCYSVTSDRYCDSFGFTEQEVKDALQCQDMQEFEVIKATYDGFIFGNSKDIYNPWSITCYMKERKCKAYWINTASNDLIGDLIRRHSCRIKRDLEALLQGASIHKQIDEDIAFQYLDQTETSFWSLLLACGYVKAENVEESPEYTECDISITNLETMAMFRRQILKMFPLGREVYHEFVEALLAHDEGAMNLVLNDLTESSMSYFDTGNRKSVKAPENFYHGLVLGLIASLHDRYMIRSNRESGRGRYDIAMYPKNEADDAYILEFKLFDPKSETSLEETADRALAQIENKDYRTDLIAAGIDGSRIYMLGLGFKDKEAFVKFK